MPKYKEATAKAQIKCFIEFANDVLNSGAVYEHSDHVYLSTQIATIQESLQMYPTKAHNDLSKMSSLWEEFLSAILKRHNPYMVTAEEIELKNLAGVDIVPNIQHPKREASLASGLIGLEAKVCTFSPDSGSELYTGSISDVDHKFTTLMILLLDPNFEKKPYRIVRLSTTKNVSKHLTFNIGSVDRNKHKTLNFTPNPKIDYKGDLLDVAFLGLDCDDYYEYDLARMANIINERKPSKAGISYLSDLFACLVEEGRKRCSSKSTAEKEYPKNPDTTKWKEHIKLVDKRRVIVDRRNGIRKI